MSLPEAIAALLRGRPDVGDQEQAFPFLTVDANGFPHVALLSRRELDVGPDGTEVLAVVASPRTRANLERDGRAALIAIGGTTAHYAKLRLTRHFERDGLLACAFALAEHKADSLGIPLEPISFRTTEEVRRSERWEVSARLLDELAAGAGGGGDGGGHG